MTGTTTRSMKGPLSYIGGKNRIAAQIVASFPEHKTFVEVFAGGAQVFFHKEPSTVEVLNDLDGEVVTFYRVCQSHFEELVRYMRFVVASREWFDLLQSADPKTLTDIQRAARFFYLQKNAYAGLVRKRRFGYSVTEPSRFNPERRDGSDLSSRTIVIEPSDPEYSVGLNPLEVQPGGNRFVQIAEFAQLLKQRWQLDALGARTDELLRNTLYVLSDNRLTLLEAGLLLSNETFRSTSLKHVGNAEVRQYFELRYDPASEPMRAVMREPILNKLSAFTADPQFRGIVGQQRSTFSIVDALDDGHWVILNLNRGRLGEQAATLGGLLFAKFKNALFARRRRDLFTLYADEIQNLVAYGADLEVTLSQSRKFGVGIVSANQFLDQFPPDMRAAVMAMGTHVLFQLAPQDAQAVAMAFDGGKPLVERLKNLPRRHMVVKTGSERWQEARVPRVSEPTADWADLYNRCRARWARKRTEVEAETALRQAAAVRTTKDALNDWE